MFCLRKLAIIAFAVTALACSIMARAQQPEQVTMESLMPQGSAVIGNVDAFWLWNATEAVRNLPDALKVFKKTEKELGISFDDDIIPHLGRIGFAIPDISSRKPNILFIAEVKDRPALATAVAKYQEFSAKMKKTKWVPINHWGVPLKRARFDGVQVTSGMIGDYFVLGIGQGVAERAVNAYQKRLVSIQANTSWADALNEFSTSSKDPAGWMGINYGVLMSGAAGKVGQIPAIMRVLVVMGLQESPEELRIDAVNYPVTAEAKSFYTGIKAKSQGVTGSSLMEMPQGTFAVIMMSNLPVWIAQIKEMMLSVAPDTQTRQMMAFGINAFQPLLDAAGNITGEAGAALTWREGEGFGFIALGETSDTDTAAKSAITIASFARQMGGHVEQSDAFWELPDINIKNEYIDLKPAWGANGKWFTITTNSGLVSAPKTSLQFPQELKGADMAEFGNLSFLPSLLDILAKGNMSGKAAGIVKSIQQLGLEKVEWVSWSNIDGQTGVTRSATVVKNLDWRRMLSTIMHIMPKPGR